MSSRRTMILIGAIAMGALAAFVLLNYVRGLEDDQYGDAQLVDVFVVSQDIGKDTTAEVAMSGLIEVRQIPNEFRPANAVQSLDQISGKIAVTDLTTNQILVPGMFVDPAAAQASFAELIPEGQVAVSLQLDQVRSVGGFLVPGDEVNVLVVSDGVETTTDPDLPEDLQQEVEEAQDSTAFQQPARYLYQRVKILAIGNRVTPLPGETVDSELNPSGAGIITFMVPAEAAQRILSVDSADIVLTLVPDDYEARPIAALEIEDINGLLPGEDPLVLTPYGPEGFAADGDRAEEGTEDSVIGENETVGDPADPGEGDAPAVGEDERDGGEN